MLPNRSHWPFQIRYFACIFSGIPATLVIFLLGLYSHVHWSSYVALRTICTAVIAAISLTYERRWTEAPVRTLGEQTLVRGGEPHPLWISLVAAMLIGPIANIQRVVSVYGCRELEAFEVGASGIVGNIVKMGFMAVSTFYAYMFFEEELTFYAAFGAALIAVGIVAVTGIRIVRRSEEREGNAKTAEEKSALIKDEN